MYLAGTLWLSLVGVGIGSGCATTSEETSATVRSGPRPPARCEQYLAMLSDERKQALETQYGIGGSCWTGTKQHAQECDETCGHEVNQIIRSNLNKSDG